MSACPTYTIKSMITGEIKVINQSDYHSPFITGSGRFKSVLSGGEWDIVTECNKGGDEGYKKSEKNIDMMVGLEMKREVDRIGKR